MAYAMIQVSRDLRRRALSITLNRPDARNGICRGLLEELHRALDEAETDREVKVVILEGRDGIFCTGMDFREVLEPAQEGADTGLYMRLLRRFSESPRAVIAKVDGQVLAGGVGFVAAADLVVASPRSTFALSEALWGLLPAQVLPYLVRRVGFQRAYAMALTTQTVSAEEAREGQLVDLLAADPDDEVRRLCLRLGRLDARTVVDLKRYCRRLWVIGEEMEQLAVTTTTDLLRSDRVRHNIRAYVEQSRFPWES